MSQQELHTSLAKKYRCCNLAGADEAHLGELAECIAELEQANLDNAALKEEVQVSPPEHHVPSACMHEAACHLHLKVLQGEHPRSRSILAAALLPSQRCRTRKCCSAEMHCPRLCL